MYFTDILVRAHKLQKKLKSKPKIGNDIVLVSEVLERSCIDMNVVISM